VLCQQRSLEAFHLNKDTWRVNVQALSGTSANLAVYIAFLKPHDRFMGLFLADGGHLSHGFYTARKKISASSMFFESLPYRVNETTGLIDFDNLRRDALLYKPKLIVCGASAYPR
jgi:glycine hydroxymethyltransferase